MSSSCSSIDLGIDPDFDEMVRFNQLFLTHPMDFSRTSSCWRTSRPFADQVNHLRNALDPNTYVPDGENKCVQIHASLALVSAAIRDLLVRYPVFKTSVVLLPASELVQSVKELNCEPLASDCVRIFQCIERLEAAIGNTLRSTM
ncbi:hypothetical protein M3Y99_00176000 [Aphelenchoides fujianensis]|nr:hypothetical protein M3Y99_00176000 [Aphelenchoides fujianensis]